MREVRKFGEFTTYLPLRLDSMELLKRKLSTLFSMGKNTMRIFEVHNIYTFASQLNLRMQRKCMSSAAKECFGFREVDLAKKIERVIWMSLLCN